MRRAFLVVGILVLFAGIVLTGCSLLRVPPSVDFTASSVEGPAPLAVVFMSHAEGTPVSYAWSFGDDRTSNEPNPVHVYTEAGIYSVWLTVEFAEHEPVTLIKKRLVTVENPLRKAILVCLYWVSEDQRLIKRGDRAGGVSELLVNEWESPDGMDVGDGKLYWVTTTLTGGTLQSADLDGSNRLTLLEEENRLGGVAVDAKRGKIYWTCLPESPRSAFEDGEWDGALKRANLDGSEVEILVEYPFGAGTYADQVVVNAADGTVYWSLVGDDFEGVIRWSMTSAFDEPHDLIRGVGHPRGMALDTTSGHNLYYTVEDELRRVPLWWWGSKSTILTGLDSPTGVAVDSIGYYVYVGTSDGILRAVTDGTNLETLFPDEGQVGSVILPD